MTKKTVSGTSQLEMVGDDGVRLVTLTVGMTLYMKAPLSKNAKGVLAIYDRFLSWCPKEALAFYATENMRRHKPISKSTFGMLPTWLKPAAPAREFIRLQLTDGEQYQDAPRHKFDAFGVEPKSKQFVLGHANLMSLAFPADSDAAAATTLRDRFLEICELMPFQSGHSGHSFECSKYASEQSQTHAWSLSMRHPGVDISRITDDAIAVGRDAVKGVGWLTALGGEFVSTLGGLPKIKRALPRDVELIELKGGVVLQAGSAPAIGDVNRSDKLPLVPFSVQTRCPARGNSGEEVAVLQSGPGLRRKNRAMVREARPCLIGVRG